MVARLGERAEHAHGAEIHSVGVESETAVRHAALKDRGAHVAEVLPAGRAVAAGPAARDEAAHHVVAGLDLRDAGAHLLDDPGPLMAADDRVSRWQLTVCEVQIRMAQACGGVLNQHLARPGPVEIQLHQFERLARLEQYCSSGFHCHALSRCFAHGKNFATPAATIR